MNFSMQWTGWRRTPGSALVPSAGFGVPPKRTSLRSACSSSANFPDVAADEKFVAAGRRNQHPRRVRSAELFAALILLFAGIGLAKEAAPVSEPEMVIVPYDPAKPAAQQKPDQFYLPYEHFLELWEAAKEQRAGKKPEAAPVAFVLSTARYEGVLGERAVAFTGKLDVTTYNEPWVAVPLPFKDVKIGALKIDGVAAAYDGAQIIVEKPGRHTVEIAFEIPLRLGAQTIDWGIPRTGATLVALTLPDERTRATITPGSGVIERTENGRKIVTAALGSTERVRIQLEASAGEVRVVEPAVANFGPWVTVSPGLETTRAAFTFSFPKAQQDRFTVFFEKGLALVGLEAADVKSWKLAEHGERQALEILLNEPARETYELSITTERPSPPLPFERRAPRFSAAARRLEAGVALFATGPVEVTAQPSPTLRQIRLQLPASETARLIAGYEGEGDLTYRAAAPEPRREARVDYVYQVNRRKIELIASLQLFAKGDDLSTATLSLPAQFEVQAVESERLQDWWRDGDTLQLRFRGVTPQMTQLVVYLVRQFAAAPTELEVRPLVLEGFKKVGGEAVIAAHKGVEAAMKLSGDGREMGPAQAATDFQILPPLERKRGFSFKTQNFAAQVALTALPAKTNALWVMHAQAHEGWVALSTHARLTMRQGSIDRAAFSLPAAVAEARVSGAEVRETRSRVEGDRRVYEVQFQNDVYEAVEFTIDLEQPNPGEAALPAITFPDAQMTSGFVLTENASEFEMKLKTSGVDPAPTSEIPFLPALTKGAGVFRVQPNWAVTIGVERLEKATARAAFVAWAELTTALRRDGTEWHRATYHLQNRSLQFLPVKLPAGAELMSVRVAGQNVRADAGQVGGTAAILVPLIKTKPGDLSYDVELVYRVNGPALSWWARRKFDDPELLGITVERTFWNVWLPDDRKLQNSSGNMEPVLAEVNKAEKLESKFAEWKALASIVSSETASYEIRANARANVERLKKEIETENRDDNFTDSYRFLRKGGKEPSPTPAEETVGKKGLAQQGEYVANKRREVSEQLGREVQKLAEADKNAPQAGQIIGVNPVTAGNRSGNLAISANAIDALLFGQQANVQVPAQNDVAVQSDVQGQRWTANNAFAQQAPAVSTPVPGAAPGKNLYLNDNIVWNARVAEPAASAGEPAKKIPAPAKPAGKAGSADVRAMALPAVKSELQPQQERAALEKAAAVEDEKKPQVSALNTSRGNTLRFQEEQAKQQAAVPGLPLQAMTQAPAQPVPQLQLATEATRSPAPSQPGLVAGGAGSAARPSAQGYTGGTTVNAGTPTISRFTSGGTAGVAANAPADDEAQRLQTAGRISLAVDFPTEGQLFHFKKVKANAQLELTAVTPESFVRWKYLGAALALAAVLGWLSRIAGRRAARTARAVAVAP
jgi:hypothetical protein